MFPFAVKALCFVLSILGTITCWIVLYAFAKTVGSMWAPMYYCCTVTILQGVWCLGMIWKMNPEIMPYGWCMTQVAVINFCAFCLTGVCVVFTFAITSSILWESKDASTYSTLQWRRRYLIPLAVFPFSGSLTQILVVHRYNAVLPADGLNCDATQHLWTRFLGYAGVPLCASIPCFCVTIAAAFKIRAMHKYQAQQRTSRMSNMPQFSTVLDTQTVDQKYDIGFASSSPTRSSSITRSPSVPRNPTHRVPVTYYDGVTPSRPPLSLMITSPTKINEEHFSPNSGSSFSRGSYYDGVTPALPSTPRSPRPVVWKIPGTDDEKMMTDSDSDVTSAFNYKRATVGSRMTELSPRLDEEAECSPFYTTTSMRLNRMSQQIDVETPIANLAPAIWRLALFQLAFFSIQVLSMLTTLIDIIKKRSEPSPFGTHHVALLGAAWGPALVFSHLPGVRRHLMDMLFRR